MSNMRILAVLAWAGLSFVAAYAAQTSRAIAQPGVKVHNVMFFDKKWAPSAC
jgi:hypothetical protein